MTLTKKQEAQIRELLIGWNGEVQLSRTRFIKLEQLRGDRVRTISLNTFSIRKGVFRKKELRVLSTDQTIRNIKSEW